MREIKSTIDSEEVWRLVSDGIRHRENALTKAKEDLRAYRLRIVERYCPIVCGNFIQRKQNPSNQVYFVKSIAPVESSAEAWKLTVKRMNKSGTVSDTSEDVWIESEDFLSTANSRWVILEEHELPWK